MSMMDQVHGVQKSKLLILNIACLLLIAYFTVLTCRQIIYATPVYDNDYKTFYMSLRDPLSVYNNHFYVRVIAYSSVEQKSATTTTAKTTPALNAVNMNTPPMCVLLKALVNASDKLWVNAIVWSLSSLLGAAISLYVLLRLFKTLRLWYYLPLLLLLFLSWPSLVDLKLGQVSYFVLPFLCVGFLLVCLKQERFAAIVLGLVASLKLFFLIFILFFVVKREFRLSFLSLVSFLFFFFLPVLYFHWPVYHDFFQLTQNDFLIFSHAPFPINGSLLGVVAHLVKIFNLSPHMAQIRFSVIILSLYIVVRWLMYDYSKIRLLPQFSDELRFSSLIIIALLLSPLSWIYYFLFLVIPVVVFFKISERYALSKAFFIFFIFSLILPYFAWVLSTNKIMWVIRNFSVFAALLCWVICICFAVNAVSRANPPAQRDRKILFGILCCHVLVNVILLLFNYGLPYFLDISKKRYRQDAMPAISIPNNTTHASNPIFQIQRQSS